MNQEAYITAKKILIISTSARKNSNSDIIADAFMNGAKNAGNEVEKVSLAEKRIAFCRGCFGCLKLGRCVIKDDANEITEKMFSSDVIVWATPIYYYEMCGQMKTMIDRAKLSVSPRLSVPRHLSARCRCRG